MISRACAEKVLCNIINGKRVTMEGTYAPRKSRTLEVDNLAFTECIACNELKFAPKEAIPAVGAG